MIRTTIQHADVSGGFEKECVNVQLTKTLSLLVVLFFGLLSRAGAQTPTITGANAFWWLGSGILSDGGTCSGKTGPCYYAQANWTANPNGNPGSPTWTVVNNSPLGGSVSLNCSTCTTVVATATSPSAGCVYDVSVTVTYNGNTSAPFNVQLVQPTTTTLQSGSPVDQSANAYFSTTGLVGYVTTTSWNLTDSCGNSDGGLDINESFGLFTADTVSNWPLPAVGNSYYPGSVINDYLFADGPTSNSSSPQVQNPQIPLGSTKIYHDYPWVLRAFSQTSGNGVTVRTDTQQWYEDHGRHQ
jgi:hypothetical protein